MREALHIRFEEGMNSPHGRVSGHQTVTVFMDGANCGTLTLRNEEAFWFKNICASGCYNLELSYACTGKQPEPSDEAVDAFMIGHRRI